MRLLGGYIDQRFHFGAGELAAMARQMVVFLNDLDCLIDAFLFAFYGQPCVVQVRAHAQSILEQAHVFIERAKKGFDLSGNVYGTSHPSGGSLWDGNGLADVHCLLTVVERPQLLDSAKH